MYTASTSDADTSKKNPKNRLPHIGVYREAIFIGNSKTVNIQSISLVSFCAYTLQLNI